MASPLRPILLYGEFMSPNPQYDLTLVIAFMFVLELIDFRKIRIILEELDIPYQNELVKFNEAKSESYLKLNVNGRLPTIHDPNTDITLWEVSR